MSIKRLPLYTPPENRMASTVPDGKLVNCVVENFTGEKAIRTRPGVQAAATNFIGINTLHSFSGTDGANPRGVLALDGAGNLYGTTDSGGASSYGTIFKIATGGTGFTVLHSFSNTDGASPYAGAVLDGAGNLYGTTERGGASSYGTIFKIATDGTGFTVLHSFSGTDGANPSGVLALDGAGNLYGTTYSGGASNYGTIFKIATGGTGFTVLHSFSNTDGAHPYAGAVLDGAGSLYGTTYFGGASSYGTVFKVATDGTGFAVLHTFSNTDGANPLAGLVLDSAGNLYGTTELGGTAGDGVVFQIPTFAAASVGLGMYVWSTDRYSVFATLGGSTYTIQVYKNQAAFGTPITGVAAANLHRFDFVETRGATPRLMFHNSIISWYTDGTTLTNMSGTANYPTSLVQGVAYVDGYILVMTTKATMYNSAIDDPTTWSASDFITAEIAPGAGVYMTSLLNFAVCVKQWSIEFMYDAANATGSPFAPYSGSKISIGTNFAETVAILDGVMFLLAQSYSGGYFVAIVDNMKPKTISVPAIDRLLSGKPLDPLNTYASAFRVDGHAYYVLTLGYTDTTNITVVYDATTGIWSEWFLVGGTNFPFRSTTYSGAAPELQHATQFFIGAISSANVSDWIGNIQMQIQTPIFDGGNTMRKFLRRFELVGDRLPGGTATLLTSDDDYQTWTTQGTIPMDASRNDIWQLGAFRRRAFQINLSNTTTARILMAELEIDEGVR